jgi:hypothetical protein
MKTLISITAFIGGLLLILVPRYILPACEFEGFPHMHCSDTARAEQVTGMILMAIGITTFFFKRRELIIASAVVACIVFAISIWLPDKIGYCLSPRMPCHYGMVPGVRFIDVTGVVIMIIGIIGLAKTYRKKGNHD